MLGKIASPINETALTDQPKETTYSVQQMEQLLGSMDLNDNDTELDWLGTSIKEITIDELSSDTAMLYHVKKVNNMQMLQALYDTG